MWCALRPLRASTFAICNMRWSKGALFGEGTAGLMGRVIRQCDEPMTRFGRGVWVWMWRSWIWRGCDWWRVVGRMSGRECWRPWSEKKRVNCYLKIFRCKRCFDSNNRGICNSGLDLSLTKSGGSLHPLVVKANTERYYEGIIDAST